MSKVVVHIGRESSDDELNAVKDAFVRAGLNADVSTDLVRMSMDWRQLPMAIIISAQALAPKLLWSAMNIVTESIYGDERLSTRMPTVVVKRRTYDVILTDETIYTRSGFETKEYGSLVELMDFENLQSKSLNSSENS